MKRLKATGTKPWVMPGLILGLVWLLWPWMATTANSTTPTPPPGPSPTPTPTEPPALMATPFRPDESSAFEHQPIVLDTPVPIAPPTPTPEHETVLKDVPKFLTLPFPRDPAMVLLQGWFYDSGGLQQGIDYFRYASAEDAERMGRFTGFPVVASADGYACGQLDDAAETLHASQTVTQTGRSCVRGYGHRVFIRHDVRGATYYTYYGHLEQIADHIPLGNRTHTVPVKRGEVIGYAGNTGTNGGTIHLHYGLLTGGGQWVDPYDLRSRHEVYPDPNRRNRLYSGLNDYWTTNPPSYAIAYFDPEERNGLRPGVEDFWDTTAPAVSSTGGSSLRSIASYALPEGAVLAPSHNTAVAGPLVLHGWARMEEEDEGQINKIEIWLDGKLHCTVAYGLPHAESGGNYGFQWEWDTTHVANGEHAIQVRAVGDNGSRILLPAPHADNRTTLLVNVQNPAGVLESPHPGDTISGQTTVSGWVTGGVHSIARVEVWVDGDLRGTADYGRPHVESGGPYGFAWVWDTGHERNQEYHIQIRAVTDDGHTITLPNLTDEAATRPVQVHNQITFRLDSWSVR